MKDEEQGKGSPIIYDDDYYPSLYMTAAVGLYYIYNYEEKGYSFGPVSHCAQHDLYRGSSYICIYKFLEYFSYLYKR